MRRRQVETHGGLSEAERGQLAQLWQTARTDDAARTRLAELLRELAPAAMYAWVRGTKPRRGSGCCSRYRTSSGRLGENRPYSPVASPAFSTFTAPWARQISFAGGRRHLAAW